MRVLAIHCLCCVALGCGRAVESAAPARPAVTTPVAVVAPAPIKTEGHRGVAVRRPIEQIERVLIISIDGLRPDLALRAYMPRLRALCERGSFTFWARTSAEAYTLPCHVSMLTGVSPARHGVTWNDYIEESYPNVPTLFELAKQAGFSTAFVAGKMKFIVLAKPGTVDDYFLPADEPVSDQEVASRGAQIVQEHRPHVLFVHFPGVDTAGHDLGWGSPQQITAIESADRALGAVLDSLTAANVYDSTLIIVTADHGGAAQGHAAGDPLSHFIPWIVAGPGIRPNHDLTSEKVHDVRVEDTFATACDVLGIAPGRDGEGKSLVQLVIDRKIEASR